MEMFLPVIRDVILAPWEPKISSFAILSLLDILKSRE
jgi:hypothetical protein